MTDAAYTRLPVDERRRQLLDLGVRLFAERAFDELSMVEIADEAGISKALLYHYFPSKRAYFAATLEQAADEVARRMEPDLHLPPLQALAAGIDGYLAWIADNTAAYQNLILNAGSVVEARSLVADIRDRTARRILAGLGMGEDPAPRVRASVSGWLWYVDGAVVDWLQHGDLERSELRDLLVGSFLGALTAAGGSTLLPS